MAPIERIDVAEARRKAAEGRALLVCAYEDDARCRSMMIERALPFSEFEARAGALPKDQEVIFYCA